MWRCNDEILHWDISLSPNTDWQSVDGNVSGEGNVQGALAHELGHGLGLKHCSTAANGAKVNCGRGVDPIDVPMPTTSDEPTMMSGADTNLARTLAPDDIAGIQFIYGRTEFLENTVFEDDDGADDDVWYSRSKTITTPTSLDIMFEWSDNDNGCDNNGPFNCNFVQLFPPRVLNLASGDVLTFSLRLDEDDSSDDCVYLKVLVNGNLAFPEQSAEPWDVGAIKIWAAVR